MRFWRCEDGPEPSLWLRLRSLFPLVKIRGATGGRLVTVMPVLAPLLVVDGIRKWERSGMGGTADPGESGSMVVEMEGIGSPPYDSTGGSGVLGGEGIGNTVAMGGGLVSVGTDWMVVGADDIDAVS